MNLGRIASFEFRYKPTDFPPSLTRLLPMVQLEARTPLF